MRIFAFRGPAVWNYVMLMIRYVTLCPHIRYPRVVQ